MLKTPNLRSLLVLKIYFYQIAEWLTISLDYLGCFVRSLCFPLFIISNSIDRIKSFSEMPLNSPFEFKVDAVTWQISRQFADLLVWENLTLFFSK